ncbi:MAG TPA: response regulator transcription factor, partial [Bacteroidia bacterium]|nr:response regulator transcription factor [Bacteroidia bacterium]
EDALNKFRSSGYDLVMTDVMMPKKDGFELVNEIRKESPRVPVIFITARNRREDMIKGYQKGAMDYITKPLDSELLIYKIKALLGGARRNEHVPELFLFGRWKFETAGRVLHDGKENFRLSPREAELLLALLGEKNSVVKKSVILKKIWGDDSYYNARSMDVYVTRLRGRFRNDPAVVIESVYGTGIKISVGEL